MDFNDISGAHRMHWVYIVLTLLLTCAAGAEFNNSYCNYIYDHGCHTSGDITRIEFREGKSHSSCTTDDVANDIKFTMLLAKDPIWVPSVLKVNFSLPNVECRYEVALLVNSSITNAEDCKNHMFHKSSLYSTVVHSREKTICILPNSNDTASFNCEKKEPFNLFYDHIFTGCYALLFTVDGHKHFIRGNKYLVTTDKRVEVAEPKFRCYYKDLIVPDLSKELVTFALSVSVLSGTAGMILTLAPISYLDENKENVCNVDNQEAMYTWEVRTDKKGPELKNCSLTTVQFENDTYTKNVECNFALPIPRNVSYCFKVVLDDERCQRETVWNPPPFTTNMDKPACEWLQKCTRVPKNSPAIEYNGIVRENKQMNSDNILLLPIAITVILIILIVTGTILFVYRLHTRHARQRIYMSTNLRDFKITASPTQIDSVETTDDETYKGSNNGDECDAIILLYARGSPTFMSFMTDFREILKIHCGCHVRDWYAASEWDAVARVGPEAWVADLLKQKHRALWIDTPRARSLFDSQWRNNYLIELKRPYDRQLDEEAISDFRDIALPSVLETAKRNVGPELVAQYSRHFVVRLEGFEASSRREDPFEDLSPHTRYLVPYHLKELCAHLSSWRMNINTPCLKTEEGRLRERLISMKTNGS